MNKGNNVKITVLQGLPGSGKSTKAKELVKNNLNTVRLNKDLLREMVYFLRKTWDKKDMGLGFRKEFEPLIVRAQFEIAEMFLNEGISVVIDDTNFSKKHINRYQQLAQKLGCEFGVIVMDVDVDTCIERDRKRQEGSVGEQTIRSMAKQHKIGVTK